MGCRPYAAVSDRKKRKENSPLLSKISTTLFGRLEETGLKGTSESWRSFLQDMQRPIRKTFDNEKVLPSSIFLFPDGVLDTHHDKFNVRYPKLLPMDLHTANVIVTPELKIRVVDLKSVWSGDPLCSFAQFFASTNGTLLGQTFLRKLPASEDID